MCVCVCVCVCVFLLAYIHTWRGRGGTSVYGLSKGPFLESARNNTPEKSLQSLARNGDLSIWVTMLDRFGFREESSRSAPPILPILRLARAVLGKGDNEERLDE